ncbi:ABC transporter ATP-binding protein [Streptomyces sp. H10-C2]|uniref:ATP-binding cassette domain-containing protein n=1 Tax=unclassified Streptomyces TaxID=2593676 RepID=UPI0024BACE73|nr:MULTISPECIES: ABC transporter ATP-binding protein [unclassified Streptomyces]MDJ0347032.1 ABC transporter ATP-binding protein [Streptomyces sp. PH10-H1]MDJ0375300.1 ABC transporter ATP-binding protein [Streptomyces sp. H10-C2]
MTGSRTSVRSRARSFLRARPRVLLLLAGWSLLESAQTFLSGYGVARALDSGFLAGRTGTGLWWLAAAAGAIVIGGLATRQVFQGLADLVEPLRDGLVRSVVTRALTRSLDDSGRAADSAAVSQLTNQTEMARDSFAGLVLVARSFVFTAVGALVGLASLDTQLLLIVVPPLVGGLALFLATLAPMAARQEAFLRADEALSARFGTIATGVRDVVACGSQAAIADDTHRMIGAEADAARSLARWAAVRTLALGIAGQLPIGLLLLCAPWLLDRGLTTGSLLGALTYLTQALLPALHTLMNALGAAGTRLLVVLRRLTDDTRPGNASIVGRAVAPVVGGGERPAGLPKVEVTGLTFAYGPEAAPVLRDLHLTIGAGEHWAVVGPSGIGKSTLTALIAGVLTPDRGRITVGGCPAGPTAGADPSLRRVLIPQQAYVFTGTLRENLLYLCARGAPAEAVRASVEAVGLGPLMRRIGGLHAPVDPASLSQGERQLIALCRAHLSPAPLVLLDEATCHLDPAAEAQVERAFAERPGTLIVVAHRISSARRADRILLLDGVHAAQGTHQELLASSALYQDLVGRWHASHL